MSRRFDHSDCVTEHLWFFSEPLHTCAESKEQRGPAKNARSVLCRSYHI